MPKGRLYDWEGMAMMGRLSPETRWVKGFLVVYLCVSSLSLIDAQKTVPVLVTNWPHHTNNSNSYCQNLLSDYYDSQ